MATSPNSLIQPVLTIALALLLPVIMGFAVQEEKQRILRQDYLSPGEHIEYRVHYGFINAGEATLHIDKKIHSVNNRPCYKIDVFGQTKGFFDMVTSVRDNWGTYMDTASLASQTFYQSIKEGKYLKKEIIEFDQQNHQAVVHRLNKKDSTLIKKDQFPTTPYIQDIISGNYYIRTIDFDTIQINSVFSMIGFFDDTIYTVKIKYLGHDKLKTKLGTYDTFVISPIMPKNSFFRGKNPIRAWISDDKNRIPLKVKAELIIGSLEIDIRSYRHE